MTLRFKKFAGLSLLAGFTLAGPSLAFADAICHQNKNNVKMINVGGNAAAAHIAHGDSVPNQLFLDADGDGFGSSDVTTAILACGDVDGYVSNSDDLDDNNATLGDYEEVGAESADVEGEEDVEEY